MWSFQTSQVQGSPAPRNSHPKVPSLFGFEENCGLKKWDKEIEEEEHVYPMQVKGGAVDDMWLAKGVKA